MKKILPFFSYLFHPIFTGILASVLYFAISDRYFDYITIYLFLVQVLLMTVFIPLALFYLLMSLGKIETIMVPKVKQRKIPLILQIILLFFLIYKSIKIEELPELHYFFLGTICSSLLALAFIYLNKKASLHMLGISSMTLFCIGLCVHFQNKMIFLIAFLILCNGLVASSRLVMKAHTKSELVLGLLIGVIPQFILYFIWL